MRIGWLAAVWLLIATAVYADPPGRVGRIAQASGEVHYQVDARAERTAGEVNLPVTTETVLATGPSARAEVRVGSTSLWVDGASEIAFLRLDDEQMQVRLLAGRMAVRVRYRDPAGELSVVTPQGTVWFDDVGHYRIDLREDQTSTGFSVHEGVARLDLNDTSLIVQAGNRIEAWGTPGASGHRAVATARDAFDAWTAAGPREPGGPTTRYVSPEMTGYEELDRHGGWREVADYGPVWVPHATAVPAGWAPYRWGRWSWVEPWGWTWVDRAPWGFAPFHYGRWVHHQGLWCWAPGAYARRPVYAPALVGWVGRPGTAVTIASGPAVGWFPLGPREVYHPPHRHGHDYLRNVNHPHIRDAHMIRPYHPDQIEPGRSPYRNAQLPHAVTMVQPGWFARGAPVTPNAALAPDPHALSALPIGPAPSFHAPPRPFARVDRAPRIVEPGYGVPGHAGPRADGHRGYAPRIDIRRSDGPPIDGRRIESSRMEAPRRDFHPEPRREPREARPEIRREQREVPPVIRREHRDGGASGHPPRMHLPPSPAPVHIQPPQGGAVRPPAPMALPRPQAPRMVASPHIAAPVVQPPRPQPPPQPQPQHPREQRRGHPERK